MSAAPLSRKELYHAALNGLGALRTVADPNDRSRIDALDRCHRELQFGDAFVLDRLLERYGVVRTRTLDARPDAPVRIVVSEFLRAMQEAIARGITFSEVVDEYTGRFGGRP